MYKKTIAAMAALMSAIVTADPIATDTAEQVVRSWAQSNESLYKSFPSEITSITTFKGRNLDYYLAKFDGGGWVVLSSDDNLTPVIAYSMTGDFVLNDSNPVYAMLTANRATNTEPNQESQREELQYNTGTTDKAASVANDKQAKPKANATNKSRWSRLRTDPNRSLKAATHTSSVVDPRVDPLIQTIWGQSGVPTGNCYNYYTPFNYPCGCVATSMAQIMHYHKFPTNKVDAVRAYSATYKDADDQPIDWTVSEDTVSDIFSGLPFGGPYEWDKMVNDPRQLVSPEQNEEPARKAIGQLTRDCGITMQTFYSSTGSGAYSTMIPSVLVNQFGYSSGLLRTFGQVPLRETLMAMLASFDAKLPCVLSLPGHSVIADGYGYSDNRLYIHLNYGWEGAGDAWYAPPESGEDETDYPSVAATCYNMWPPSKCPDSNRTIVSGRVSSSTIEVAKLTVIASNVISSAVFETTTDARGIYALFLPPEQNYDIYVKDISHNKSVRVHTMMSRNQNADYGVIWSGGSVLNIPQVDLNIDSESEPIVDVYPVVIHRWSFTSGSELRSISARGYNDASIRQPPEQVEFKENKAFLKGGTNTVSSLDLGNKLLNTRVWAPTDGMTIEMWAREDTTRQWSRVFEYGDSNSNTFIFAWTSGRNIGLDHAEIYEDGNRQLNDRGCGPYEPGKWYHLAVTFKPISKTVTDIRFYKRNPDTGELINSGMLTQAMSKFWNREENHLYIGRSTFPSDDDACATYDEIRMWNCALTEEQLLSSCLAGPDAERPADAAMNPASVSPRYITKHPIIRRAHHYDYARGDKHDYELTTVIQDLDQYTEVESDVSIKELYRTSIDSPGPSILKRSTLRYEGTFYVPKQDAGVWRFTESFDDHACFWIDNNLILYNPTYKNSVTMTANISPGWHTFTLVVGDAYGGYGSSYAYEDKLVPMVVSINGADPVSFDEDNLFIATSRERACFVDERLPTTGTTGSWSAPDEESLSEWDLNTLYRTISADDNNPVSFTFDALTNRLTTVIETEVSAALFEDMRDLGTPTDDAKTAIGLFVDGSAAVLTRVNGERKWVFADVKGLSVSNYDPITYKIYFNQLANTARCDIVDRYGIAHPVVVRDTGSRYWSLAITNRNAPKGIYFYGDGEVKKIYGKGYYQNAAVVVE